MDRNHPYFSVLQSRLRDERGQALIVAMGVLVVLTMLGVVVMVSTTAGQRSA